MRILFAVLRIGIAVAVIAAVVGQLNTSLGYWAEKGVDHVWISVVNFFSFFTIESNVATVAVGLVGAYFLLARKGEDPRWFNCFRLGVVTYMATTGIVYNLLLRGIELPQGATLGWSNEILHVVAPIYMIVDWIFAPGRKPLEWKAIWGVVVFPIVWAVYTLIRGPFTPDEVYGKSVWYPYPFLNPTLSQNGYLSVAFYVVLIAAVIGLVAAGAIWVSRRRKATV